MIDALYSGGWQDIVISAGMLVFILSVAAMIYDNETHISPVKGIIYGAAQMVIAVANASLGLWISSGLLIIGGTFWWGLSYQSYTTR